ncbi:MAG: glutamyl-tRNA reductase, partial [Woeseia sp.]
MPLKILGLNHNTAPVEIREKVAYSTEQAKTALAQVVGLDGVAEVVVVSTCNRTEFYVDASDAGVRALTDWLTRTQALTPDALESLFVLQFDDAVRHLFRVASGLDSMVLGEPQILGQLKESYRVAEAAGTTGPVLGRLFRHSFSAAKKVRTDTEIGANPVSVASTAVNLANQFYSGFEKHTALLIGAGATIRLVAQHLQARKIGRLFVANRDVTRAQELASEF